MNKLVSCTWQWMDKGPLRGLTLLLALWLAGCLFWAPARFAAQTSSLSVWHGLLLMWAVCAAVVFGVGFRPQRLCWQILFLPLPALLVTGWGLSYFYL